MEDIDGHHVQALKMCICYLGSKNNEKVEVIYILILRYYIMAV